jgi:hypothetical protein
VEISKGRSRAPTYLCEHGRATDLTRSLRTKRCEASERVTARAGGSSAHLERRRVGHNESNASTWGARKPPHHASVVQLIARSEPLMTFGDGLGVGRPLGPLPVSSIEEARAGRAPRAPRAAHGRSCSMLRRPALAEGYGGGDGPILRIGLARYGASRIG